MFHIPPKSSVDDLSTVTTDESHIKLKEEEFSSQKWRTTMPELLLPSASGGLLTTAMPVVLHPHIVHPIPVGTWQLPTGTFAHITSIPELLECNIQVMAGVVDSDYRGEVRVLLLNLGDEDVCLEKGQPIAKVITLRHEILEVVMLTPDKITTTTRGTGGFGSTDKPI
eukprot:gnl/Dysnectes_brevis/4649_a6343_555.p2 GENE.gnl/Dysnectes_brevis/4649_a6343_555~~gnl/Dysnectes_brevis/4649_a6343_555.p2  ORF type:complete len:168 (+),score=7.84 gnl/Dysnectes_brevis/4649_a6343_555:153-656(+)